MNDSSRPVRHSAPAMPEGIPDAPEEEQPKQAAGGAAGGGGGGPEDDYEMVNPDEQVVDVPAEAPPPPEMKGSGQQGPADSGEENTAYSPGADWKTTTAKEKEKEESQKNKKPTKGAKKTTTATKTTSVNKKTVKKSTKAPPKPKTGKWKAILAVSVVIMISSAVGIAICAAELSGIITAFE